MVLQFCYCTDCRHRRGCIRCSWSRSWPTNTILSLLIIRASDIPPDRIPRLSAYTFDHLAKVMQDFTEELHLDRYTLFMQDYGGPVGFRMALTHPERVQAMIIQNAVSHEEGLSPFGQFGGHSGRTGWFMRRRCEATSCPLNQPASGTSALLPIQPCTVLICGWMSSAF
jgi:pimeloyl-ACP methyl ester carboxylesterase